MYNCLMKQNTQFDFGNGWQPRESFVLYEKIIEDRGSKYSVSVGRVTNREDIKGFFKELKSRKKYLKADHNTFAARVSKDGVLYETKSDDGETGAGQTILRVMQGENVTNCVLCVTRWFGGVKLMGDRFKHVQDAAHYGLSRVKNDTH